MPFVSHNVVNIYLCAQSVSVYRYWWRNVHLHVIPTSMTASEEWKHTTVRWKEVQDVAVCGEIVDTILGCTEQPLSWGPGPQSNTECCTTLRHLKDVIWMKRRAVLKEKVILHDNVCSHPAHATAQLLGRFAGGVCTLGSFTAAIEQEVHHRANASTALGTNKWGNKRCSFATVLSDINFEVKYDCKYAQCFWCRCSFLPHKQSLRLWHAKQIGVSCDIKIHCTNKNYNVLSRKMKGWLLTVKKFWGNNVDVLQGISLFYTWRTEENLTKIIRQNGKCSDRVILRIPP